MILVLLVLLVVGYIGGATIDTLGQRSRTVGLFVLAGGHFLLLGAAMGPQGLGFLSEDVLEAAFPLLNLGFGWIGLILGLQLEVKGLLRISRHHWRIAITQTIVSGFVAFLAASFFLSSELGQRYISGDWSLIAQAFAALAMMTSPIPLSYLAHKYRLRGERSRLLLFIANIDSIFAIILFQLILISHYPMELMPVGTLVGPSMLGMSVLLGIGLGIISHFFLLYYYSRNDLLAIIVGLLFFSDGIAYALHLSPLFINMLVGCVIVNISPKAETFYRTLAQTERPVYVTLVILAGAYWRVPQKLSHLQWIAVLVCVYLLAKYIGGLCGRILAPKEMRFNVGYSLLFLPQGAIALAMSITLAQYYPLVMTSFFQTTVIVLFLITNITAHRMGRLVLSSQGVLIAERRRM